MINFKALHKDKIFKIIKNNNFYVSLIKRCYFNCEISIILMNSFISKVVDLFASSRF
jgi:hypothetical protein